MYFVFTFSVFCILQCLVGHKLFYIYDTENWPSIANISTSKRDPNERLENYFNGGAGPVIDEIRGSYHTDQYQLYSMIFNRALKDHRRTLDPARATSFIIPYDFASDSAYYKNCARTLGVCYDFRKCPSAPDVEELLSRSKWFKRRGGRDHVLIVGMNYAMDHYILKPKCKSLLLLCTNCTKFAIDDYSFMYSSDAGILARGDYWHAAPFPADFHWTRKVQRPFPWENTDRPVVVSYIGSVKSFYGPARRLRGSIVHYCEMHKEHCAHQSYGLNGTRHSFNVEGHTPLELSHRSVFCFQPIGDLMTRKGLFDTLLQGCIPVVFDPLTAAVMYTWHWEEAFWKQISVEIPFHGVAHRYLDPVQLLVAMMQNETSTGAIRRMQELIRSRVFELQYSLDAPREVYHFNSSLQYVTLSSHNRSVDINADNNLSYRVTTLDTLANATSSADSRTVATEDFGSWPLGADGAPMKDAYEICIEHMLGWHSGEVVRFRNATVPECWDGWLDTVNNKCTPGEQPKKKVAR